ncbi:MAG TPA: class I SAM-dependent methyltransferase [Gaiellaceae bacterium]|nr:class I SAM-dependent methyltransferase [Gaiellaceae bacterium]
MHGDLEAWLDAAAGTDAEFVESVWRRVLRRPVDEEARQRTLGKLADGTLSRAGLLQELVSSREFAQVAVLDGALAFAAGERARPRETRGPSRPRGLAAPAWSDERAIEIPWCLARYDGEKRVLDVGYAFAEPAYLAGLAALGTRELVGVDLAEAEVPGLRPVVADVRSLPFDDGSFDLVLCVSTLEHVGRDTAIYAVDAPRADDGDEAALRELHRVLAPGGRLLATVPTGVEEDLGWQVQRPPREWIARFERSGWLVYEDELYLHAADGWRTASLAEVESVAYGGAGPGAGAILLAELRPRTILERIRLVLRDARHRDTPRRSTAERE